MRRRQHEAAEMQRFNKNLNKISQHFEPAPSATNGYNNGYHTTEPSPMPAAVSNATETAAPTPKPESQPSWRRQEVREAVPSASSSEELHIEHNNNNNNNNSERKDLGPVPGKIKLVEEVATDEKENVLDDDKKDVKAPPPSMPNISSPTEAKPMEFPEPEQPPPPPEPQPVKSVRKPESDDEGSGNAFADVLKRRAAKMSDNSSLRRFEVKVSEAETKWKEAGEGLKEKPMIINDLDFSSFIEYEQDPLVLVRNAQNEMERMGTGPTAPRAFGGGVPPPPPPGGMAPPPPPLMSANKMREASVVPGTVSGVKLHWKPAQTEAPPVPMLKRKGTFWNKIETTPQIDTTKLAKLFEQKTREKSKPQVINIGLTKLPPISVIPTAIRKFDTSVLNKEGIEKILQTMMPSAAEIELIQEKQGEFPDLPLGQTEQFLLSLSEIDCLLERLRLWLFMLDYQNVEKDVAESLMELNNSMKEMEESGTFRDAMGILLCIGNALNGTEEFDGSIVNTFLGVPYAKPPVGSRRFHPPEMVDPWQGEYLAQTLSPACAYALDKMFPGFPGAEMWNAQNNLSEDCLSMNIWVPEKHDGSVMVWIYGGGFFSGSPSLDLYDGKVLASMQHTIVVNINYRLVAIGFLYLGEDSPVSGNMGLLDQQMALRWLHENIVFFGGDPHRVTLFGESAGGASTTAHLFAPDSEKFFSKIICNSGVITNSWATKPKDVMLNLSTKLAFRLGCMPLGTDEEHLVIGRDDMKAVIDCMTMIHTDRIINVSETLGYEIQYPMAFPFVPVDEDPLFFRGSLQEKLRRHDFKKNVSAILGTVKDEGTYWLPYYLEDTGFHFNHTLSSEDRRQSLTAARPKDPCHCCQL